MADYGAPFKWPKWTDQEWIEKKAEHVAKHGYTIYIPKIGDIIHISRPKAMTDDEKVLWYSWRRDEIPKKRREELERQKEEGRKKYKKMLSSPIPNWVSNYTSALTAWDNVQDVIVTLAAIGRIAIKLIPRLLVGWVALPVGMLWLIAAVMSMLVAPSMCILNPLKCKREMREKLKRRAEALKARGKPPEKFTKAWYNIQKKKLKYGFKGYAKSGSFMPSFSEAIQAAQVSKDIWGIGLSIGPIFGIAYDLMSGGVRWAMGQKVSFRTNPKEIEIFEKKGDTEHYYARWKRPKAEMSKAEFITWRNEMISTGTWGIRSLQDLDMLRALRMIQTVFGWEHKTNWELQTAFYCAAEIAGYNIGNTKEWWNPLENIEGIEHIEIEAFNEPNPLIEEMLREEGLDPEEGIAWPQLGKRWATYEEIQTSLARVGGANFEYFNENCPDIKLKAVMENSAIECGLHMLAELEGHEFIHIQHHAAIDIAETLLNHGYSIAWICSDKQKHELMCWMQEHEENGTRPGLKEILAYAENVVGCRAVWRGEPTNPMLGAQIEKAGLVEPEGTEYRKDPPC